MPPLVRPGKRDVMAALGDPAPTDRWAVHCSDLPDVPPLNGGPSPRAAYNALGDRDINLFCNTTTVPRRTAGDPVTIQIRGHEFERPAGYNDEHTIELELLDATNNYVSAFIKSIRDFMWSNSNGDHAGGVRALSAMYGDQGYSFTTEIWRMDGQDNAIWGYKMFGVYYRDADPIGGNLGSDAEVVRPNLTLYYDRFIDGPIRGGTADYS